MQALELPDYREKPDDVAARFERINKRRVVLEVKGLGKTFESRRGTVEALRGINFTVRKREFVCVVGRSGCGKSTLIRILSGLETPTKGELLVDGNPVHGPGADRGMVF